MKHSALSSLSVLSLLIGTLTLVGCGGAFSMPDSVVAVPGVAPAIQGSTFGGHAPVVGAHVYLLQPGTGGYGTIATSLLGTGTSTSPGGYPLHTNAAGGDPYIPAGWQYVTSDANGAWNLTGAYSCTAGYPVYVYSYGGNATNLTGTPVNTAMVQLAILGNCPSTGQTNFGSGSADQINYVYSNEVSTVAAAYVLQPFTAQGTATTNSAIYVGTSGTTQALLGIENAANTAAQLYDIQGGAGQSTTVNDGEGHVANFRTQSFTVSGSTVTANPNAGNGVVPQATIDTLANILAACVDSTGATSTQCTTLFNNATETGDSGGVKPTDIARAAMNIARYPAGNYSNGLAPTTFVANIYGIATGTVPYTPHLTTQPHDFTLAINYPYVPIGYSTSNVDVEKAESVEVDQKGQIWITAQGSGTNATPYPSADRWSPLGVPNTTNNTQFTTPAGYIFGYVSIDGNNNAWTGNANSTTGIFFGGSNGSFTTTYGANFSTAYTIITNKAGDAFYFASDSSTDANTTTVHNPGLFGLGAYTNTESQMFEMNPSGTVISGSTNCDGVNGTYTYACITAAHGATIFNSGDFVAHGAIDGTGDLWLTSENPPYQIARVGPTGNQIFEYTSNVQQPEFPSIDASGNGWIPNYEGASVFKFTPIGGRTTLTSATTGAGLVYPFGSAVDGNGNVWVTNRCGPNNTCGTTTNATTLVQINGSSNLAISPPSNYKPQAQYPATATTLTNVFLDPLNLAIDPSGNIWVTNYVGPGSGSVVEIIGTAAPVVTPLSLAAGNNVLGTKP